MHRVTTMARFRIMEEEHQAAPTSDSREMATSSTDRAQTSDAFYKVDTRLLELCFAMLFI